MAPEINMMGHKMTEGIKKKNTVFLLHKIIFIDFFFPGYFHLCLYTSKNSSEETSGKQKKSLLGWPAVLTTSVHTKAII